MHGPLRLTYALLANYMAKCQMSSGRYGPIFLLAINQFKIEDDKQQATNSKSHFQPYKL